MSAGWINPLGRYWPNYFLFGRKKRVALELLLLPEVLSTVCVAEAGYSISGRTPGVSSIASWTDGCSSSEEAVGGFLAAVFERSRSVALARQELDLPHVYRYFARSPGFSRSQSSGGGTRPSPEQLKAREELRAERMGDTPSPFLQGATKEKATNKKAEE